MRTVNPRARSLMPGNASTRAARSSPKVRGRSSRRARATGSTSSACKTFGACAQQRERSRQHRLQGHAVRDVVGRTHQVQRAAHQRAAHDRPVVQRPVQIFATEPVQAGPETGEWRSRFLGLHTAEPLHRLDGGAAFSLQQHLPRQRGPVEPSAGSTRRAARSWCAQADRPRGPEGAPQRLITSVPMTDLLRPAGKVTTRSSVVTGAADPASIASSVSARSVSSLPLPAA